MNYTLDEQQQQACVDNTKASTKVHEARAFMCGCFGIASLALAAAALFGQVL